MFEELRIHLWTLKKIFVFSENFRIFLYIASVSEHALKVPHTNNNLV